MNGYSGNHSVTTPARIALTEILLLGQAQTAGMDDLFCTNTWIATLVLSEVAVGCEAGFGGERVCENSFRKGTTFYLFMLGDCWALEFCHCM